MKKRFDVWIGLNGRFYSGLWVVATSEAEARKLVEEHLALKRSLGFSEREIRKRNPRRTPWQPGCFICRVSGDSPSDQSDPIGVIWD
jgi:hypothetical protein